MACMHVHEANVRFGTTLRNEKTIQNARFNALVIGRLLFRTFRVITLSKDKQTTSWEIILARDMLRDKITHDS